jgi:hypothetical protein
VSGRLLEVGPGRPYAVPSAAAAVARDGDVIRIAAGEYRGDVARWAANRLTICGSGGRARLFADGRSAQGKAIWVIAGDGVVVDGVDFHDAKVPDRNGAGIRTEQAGALTIRHCGFYDNENGVLGGRPGATLTIEFSEFARSGHGDGYSHNLYVNDVDRLVVRASVFREVRIGHNLKSRARESIVEHSHLMDGPEGRSSYLADFPNGGRVLLRGNLMHKGPKAENPNAIAFGTEGLKGDGDHLLTMRHNTLVVDHPGAHFLAARGRARRDALGQPVRRPQRHRARHGRLREPPRRAQRAGAAAARGPATGRAPGGARLLAGAGVPRSPATEGSLGAGHPPQRRCAGSDATAPVVRIRTAGRRAAVGSLRPRREEV